MTHTEPVLAYILTLCPLHITEMLLNISACFQLRGKDACVMFWGQMPPNPVVILLYLILHNFVFLLHKRKSEILTYSGRYMPRSRSPYLSNLRDLRTKQIKYWHCFRLPRKLVFTGIIILNPCTLCAITYLPNPAPKCGNAVEQSTWPFSLESKSADHLCFPSK